VFDAVDAVSPILQLTQIGIGKPFIVQITQVYTQVDGSLDLLPVKSARLELFVEFRTAVIPPHENL
jgi:hypothetical protein